MNTERSINGDEIDPDVLKEGMVEKNLKGMLVVIQLAQELYGIRTYEELIPFLRQKNEYGHFELQTSNTSTYNRIMGKSAPEDHSGNATLVVDKDVIADTIKALLEIQRSIAEDAREKMMEVLEGKTMHGDPHTAPEDPSKNPRILSA
ncbi:hypothetical protein K8942_02000 [Candidatus Peribacteria bacterium]|nr:MAG: hypothetical protein K8942_02000 [Candidatus Peribacteria bacterium]